MQSLMKRYTLMSLVCIAVTFNSLVDCSCPTQQTSRNNQRKHLDRLTENDIVVEALYHGKYREHYRFVVEQVWKRNNGSLHRFDSISINVLSASFRDCFKGLDWKPSYVLMLKKSEQPKVYEITLPPVRSGRKNFRNVVFNRLCPVPGSTSSSCEMRITLPEKVTYLQGAISQLECKIESKYPVTKIAWRKDEIEIRTDSLTDISIDFRTQYVSVLTLNRANNIHEGNYVCSAQNEAGERQSASSIVEVVGLNSGSFDECENPNHCMNGGTCRKLQNGDESCECPRHFEGFRCQRKTPDDLLPSSKEAEDNEYDKMKSSISTLTTTVTALALVLFFVFTISLVYIVNLRRRLKPNRDKYENEEDIYEMTTETSRELTTEFFKQESDKAVVQIKVTEPSHPIEYRPSRTPTPKITEKSLCSLNSRLPSEEILTITPLTKSSNRNVFLEVPFSASLDWKGGTPNTRRERLKAKSYS